MDLAIIPLSSLHKYVVVKYNNAYVLKVKGTLPINIQRLILFGMVEILYL